MAAHDLRRRLIFQAPERSENGLVVVSFDGEGREGVDVAALLGWMGTLGVSVVSGPYGIYDARYDLTWRGHQLTFVADTWDCYFWASAADAPALEALIARLELAADLRGM